MPDETVVMGPLAPFDVLPDTANALLVLHRTAVLTRAGAVIDLDDRPIRRWAVRTNLGQGPEPAAAGALVNAVAGRRAEALSALAAHRQVRVCTVELEVSGALVVGAATSGLRDVAIQLHGTYGWPIIPGSTLKGVAREYARQVGQPESEIVKIFGSPPQAGEPVEGAVAFFDALPAPPGVQVAEDVLTPHTMGYRDRAATIADVSAPGEHINPIPIPFLAIHGGRFVAHLAGADPYANAALDLLTDAVSDLGVGARTAAGYGYLTHITPKAGTR